MITEYHAKYFAYELSKSGGEGIDKLGRALFDASVDLNPHQIEAALFAMRSPLSKGVLLADEVGLGKTIEAGLVACQFWAEKKRKILVVCPAALRKQWEQELIEKFCLPSLILDARTARNEELQGRMSPFDTDRIVITSINFAAKNESALRQIKWDLIIIDEAHKLRNSYRESNRMGQAILRATDGCRKLLLTATPLQNSLLELYGLASLIDDHIFGELPSFKTQYVNSADNQDELRQRLSNFCWRKLRKQVAGFVKYTERKLITKPFKPTDDEHKLYVEVSKYLQEEDTYALPSGQRHLLILLVRKVLASSPRAVAGTLEIMKERLQKMLEEYQQNLKPIDRILTTDDFDDDLLDELLEDEEDLNMAAEDCEEWGDDKTDKDEQETTIDPAKLKSEIARLETFINWARSIGVDTKTRALHRALEIGFEKMAEMGASRKAVVFTESRRTQNYIKEFLDANGYAGKTVLFNGSNSDAETSSIYQAWVEKNKNSGRLSGSKAIDVRTAVTEKFRDEAEILIATEAAAEGINLQFCALVINYDLPWNPQRIEQRIGRCHRYGQEHDVVVINFLNERNEADRRVQELLEYKFNLFSGVFGVSDEVLGTIESGLDFEKRIIEIYQNCRTSEEIQQAFAILQKELEEQIGHRMQQTRRLLIDNFDEDVHSRLKVNLEGAHSRLDYIGRRFWSLTRFQLADSAVFDDSNHSFKLATSPVADAIPGLYQLITKEKSVAGLPGVFIYRINHPLGSYVLSQAMQKKCSLAEVVFDITNHPIKISIVEQLKGKSGWLCLWHLRIKSFAEADYLLFSAFTDDGKNLDQETCEKMFNCDGMVNSLSSVPSSVTSRLDAEAERHRDAIIAKNLEENNQHFIEAREQLDKWAEDMEIAAQKDLDDIKRQIRETQRLARKAVTVDEQHALQAKIAELEKKKRSARTRIFRIEDEIEEKRDKLIIALENRMKQQAVTENLFQIRWKVA